VSLGVASRVAVAVAVESIQLVSVESIKSTPQVFAWTVKSLNCVRILLCTRAIFQSAKSAPSNQTSSTNCYWVVNLCGRRLNVKTALQLVTFKSKSPTVDSIWCKGIQSVSPIKHKHKCKYIGLSQVAFGSYRATLRIPCCQAVESSTVELLYLIPSMLSLITGLDERRFSPVSSVAVTVDKASVPFQAMNSNPNPTAKHPVKFTAKKLKPVLLTSFDPTADRPEESKASNLILKPGFHYTYNSKSTAKHTVESLNLNLILHQVLEACFLHKYTVKSLNFTAMASSFQTLNCSYGFARDWENISVFCICEGRL